MNFAIIGISGKAHSGKTTTNEAIKKLVAAKENASTYKIKYLPLAAKLKDLCTELHGWDGDKTLYTNPDGTMDITRGRGILIEVGRCHRTINPNVWVDYVSKKITNLIQDPEQNNTIYIIDDIRYKNELETMKRFGKKFMSIRLSRKSQLNLDTPSEVDLDDCQDFDYFLDNNGTLEELSGLLDQIVDDVITRSKGRVHA